MSEHFAFCRLPDSVGTEGKPQLLDGWWAAFCVCVFLHAHKHQPLYICVCMLRRCVCLCVCGRGDGGGGGSKSAVIQALLSLLNDDVNL